MADEEPTPSRTLLETAACPPALRRAGTPWSMDDLEVVAVLGEGPFSTVAHCTCTRSGSDVVVKMYHKDKMNALNCRQAAREMEIHGALNHPHVIGLYAAFEDEEGVYQVQELAGGGDLYGAVGAAGGFFGEERAAHAVLRPLLSALAHIHSKGILHRDIKPENVLLSKGGEVKLADFGLAVDVRRDMPRSRVGTLDYMAPEVVRHCVGGLAPPGGPLTYGLPVDVWATGILAYELLVGGPAFEADTQRDTYARILGAEPHLPRHLSEGARDFLRKALTEDPAARPTAAQLAAHPWLDPATSTARTAVADAAKQVAAAAAKGLPARRAPPPRRESNRAGTAEEFPQGGLGAPAGKPAGNAITVLLQAH